MSINKSDVKKTNVIKKINNIETISKLLLNNSNTDLKFIQIKNDKELNHLIGSYLLSELNNNNSQLNDLVLLTYILENYKNRKFVENSNQVIVDEYKQVTEYESECFDDSKCRLDDALNAFILGFLYQNKFINNQPNTILEIDYSKMRIMLSEKKEYDIKNVLIFAADCSFYSNHNLQKISFSKFVEYLILNEKETYTLNEIDIIINDSLYENEKIKVIDYKSIKYLNNFNISDLKYIIKNSYVYEPKFREFINSNELKQIFLNNAMSYIDKNKLINNKNGDIFMNISDFNKNTEITYFDNKTKIFELIENLNECQGKALKSLDDFVKYILFIIDNITDTLTINNISSNKINDINSIAIIYAGSTINKNKLFDKYILESDSLYENEETIKCIKAIISHFTLRSLGKNSINNRSDKLREYIYKNDIFICAICSKLFYNFLDITDKSFGLFYEKLTEIITSGAHVINTDLINTDLFDNLKYIIHPSIREYINLIFPNKINVIDVYNSSQLELYFEYTFEDEFDFNNKVKQVDKELTFNELYNVSFNNLNYNNLSSFIALNMIAIKMKYNVKTEVDDNFTDKFVSILSLISDDLSDKNIEALKDLINDNSSQCLFLENFENQFDSDFYEAIPYFDKCDITDEEYNYFINLIKNNKISNTDLKILQMSLINCYDYLIKIYPFIKTFKFYHLLSIVELTISSELLSNELCIIDKELYINFLNQYETIISIKDIFNFIVNNEYYASSNTLTKKNNKIFELETIEINPVIDRLINLINQSKFNKLDILNEIANTMLSFQNDIPVQNNIDRLLKIKSNINKEYIERINNMITKLK